MLNNYSLNHANVLIGDSMRFVKQHRQQQGLGSGNIPFGSAGHSGGVNQNTQNQANQDGLSGLLSPVLMMMLFQMLSKLSSQTEEEAGLLTDTTQQANSAQQNSLFSHFSGTTPESAYLTNRLPADTINRLSSLPVAVPQPILNLDETVIRSALDTQTLSENDLGKNLLGLLHKGSNEQAQQASDLLGGLISEDRINATAFLQPEFVQQLSPDRQDLLVSALLNAGLIFQNNKPNSRLIGYMISELSAETPSEAQNLLLRYFQQARAQAGNHNPSSQHLLDTVAMLANLEQ
jgi:hypothetical protein